jgi:hypothetical protein
MPIDHAYACHLRGDTSASLYFRRKRSSATWTRELAGFVESLV